MEELKLFIEKIIKENNTIFSKSYYFDEYTTNNCMLQKVVCIDIFPFIEEIDMSYFRKECMTKFGYDIIPIDIDFYGMNSCAENCKNQINSIEYALRQKIMKFLKKHFNYFYVMYSNHTIGVFIETFPKKKINHKAVSRFKNLLKTNGMQINFIEYENIKKSNFKYNILNN